MVNWEYIVDCSSKICSRIYVFLNFTFLGHQKLDTFFRKQSVPKVKVIKIGSWQKNVLLNWHWKLTIKVWFRYLLTTCLKVNKSQIHSKYFSRTYLFLLKSKKVYFQLTLVLKTPTLRSNLHIGRLFVNLLQSGEILLVHCRLKCLGGLIFGCKPS